VRLGRERDADRVADAFVQEDAEADGRFDRAAEGRPRLRHAEVERVVAHLREQPVGRDRAVHVRGFERDDDVLKV
jgi:hypothetical protein